MDFVTACANLRSCVFSIPRKSRFDVKGKFLVSFLNQNMRNSTFLYIQQWPATLSQVDIDIYISLLAVLMAIIYFL